MDTKFAMTGRLDSAVASGPHYADRHVETLLVPSAVPVGGVSRSRAADTSGACNGVSGVSLSARVESVQIPPAVRMRTTGVFAGANTGVDATGVDMGRIAIDQFNTKPVPGYPPRGRCP